jgi:thymidylate kinase
MIISFEGVDGVGKSTLINYAMEYLREKNIKVSCVSDGYTPDQNTKSALAKICQVFAKRFEVLRNIKGNEITLYDRYIDSTYVYAPNETLTLIDLLRHHIPRPRLCFVITCDPETILQRIYQRNTDNLNLTLQDIEKTQDRFIRLPENKLSCHYDLEDRIFVDNTNLDDAITKITQHLDVLCTQIYL